MKLSIIIPLYNKEKYIDRCLKSLLDQDMDSSEYEVIIINDGSTDSGATIAQNYADNHLNIYYFKQKNSGVSVARNKGLESAKGDYVYFLDADDYLVSNVLSGVIGLCENNNLEVLEFKSKEIIANETNDKQSKSPKDLILSVLVTDGLSYITEYGLRAEAWRYFIRRDFLRDNDIKFLEGTLYEDVLFTARVFLMAIRLSKLNFDVHRYAVVPNSIVTNKSLTHQRAMANGSIVVVEKVQELISGLDSSDLNYDGVAKRLKARQQSLVFILLIRTFRYRIFNIRELNKILNNFESLEVYPMDSKVGGGNVKSALVLPIFNNKLLLFLALRIWRPVPFQ